MNESNESNESTHDEPTTAATPAVKPTKAKRQPKPKAAKPKATAKAKGKAKPKAKAKPAGERLVPADLERYTKDKEHKTAGGNVSVHCGDAVAVKLRGKSIDEVFAIAAKVLGEPEKELRAKYKHLNVGMQRMNLGNRMRAA